MMFPTITWAKLLICILVCDCLVGSAQKVANPYGSGDAKNLIRQEDVVIDVTVYDTSESGKEKGYYFKLIYEDFIESHSIDEEGEFISGGNAANNGETMATFQNYILSNNISKSFDVNRKCPDCRGSKVNVVYPNPQNILKYEFIACPSCMGTGKSLTTVTFKLICPKGRAPQLPEKPRITKQNALVKAALAGDTQSRISYARQLETGSLGAPKDTKLAAVLYAKAAVAGNAYGIEGLIRLYVSSPPPATSKSDQAQLFILRLVQAKLEKDSYTAGSFIFTANDLGVPVPTGLDYLEVKIAELKAKLLVSAFTARQLQEEDFTYSGTINLVKPWLIQLQKNPLATARSKVEFVLASLAASPTGDNLDRSSLALIKQSAVSLDPVAYGLLATISERGLYGPKNHLAAAIYYSISKKLLPDPLISLRLAAISSRYDSAVAGEMVSEFTNTKEAGLANINFLDAVFKIDTTRSPAAK